MELTSSSEQTKIVNPENHSLLRIDLNEIPSPSFQETVASGSNAFSVVKTFIHNYKPPSGSAAGLTEESSDNVCKVCGRPEVKGRVVVCDGCERGYHLSCAGIQGRQALMLDEWICAECVSNGVGSKRWPLGASSSGQRSGGLRLLDINSLPLSDGEGEGAEEILDSRYEVSNIDSFYFIYFLPFSL